MRPEHQLFHGPGSLAVLKLLERGPQSGYELLSCLRKLSPAVLQLGDASLFALLYHLEGQRLVAAEMAMTARGPRRKYALTERGRRRLTLEEQQWRALAGLMADGQDAEETGAEGTHERHRS